MNREVFLQWVLHRERMKITEIFARSRRIKRDEKDQIIFLELTSDHSCSRRKYVALRSRVVGQPKDGAVPAESEHQHEGHNGAEGMCRLDSCDLRFRAWLGQGRHGG